MFINEDSISKAFTKNLAELLEKHQMTQAELARRLGVSQQSVSDWCNGAKFPRKEKLEKIAMIFGVSVKDLIDLETIESFLPSARAEYEELMMILKAATPEQINKILAMAKIIMEG